MYRITLTRSAFKELHSLPNEVIKRISEKIDSLAETPRPQGSKKLKGTSDDLWRIRIGDYRVIYGIDDAIKVIDIVKIGHRKDVYE
jgi:mRNA interferase RelE/StbE